MDRSRSAPSSAEPRSSGGPSRRLASRRLAALLLSLLLVHPFAILDADPPIPTILSCAEPNDGEILGSVLLLDFTTSHPSAHRVSLSLGGQVIGVVPLVAGACTVPVDTSALPNGVAVFEARLLSLAGATLATIPVARTIICPSTAVLAASYDNGQLEQISLGVAAEWAGGESSPYVLLVSRLAGYGEFPEYGLVLPLPPESTEVAAAGTLSFAEDGSAILAVALEGLAGQIDSSLRLQLLIHTGGKWVAGHAVDLPATE